MSVTVVEMLQPYNQKRMLSTKSLSVVSYIHKKDIILSTVIHSGICLDEIKLNPERPANSLEQQSSQQRTAQQATHERHSHTSTIPIPIRPTVSIVRRRIP